jgi:hypothetical protein
MYLPMYGTQVAVATLLNLWYFPALQTVYSVVVERYSFPAGQCLQSFAIVCRVVIVNILAVIYNVHAHTRHTNGSCNNVGTLIFSGVANGAFCGGREIFFSGRAKCAIVGCIVFINILAVVYYVTSNASGACNEWI